MKTFLPYCLLLCLTTSLYGQRNYAPHSVLSGGNWYKISIAGEGIYKVDGAFLNTLGLGTNLPSASIRLFGNGGAMLGENANAPYTDDLVENAIEVFDGGDGIFNNNDYFLFYAPGTSRWIKDSLRQSFRYQKNLYTDSAFYFITLGNNGKRINTQTNYPSANITVTTYDERYAVENDVSNFIKSGKEWYGDSFIRGQARTFFIDWVGGVLTEPLSLRSSFASRNVNATASILTSINGINGLPLNFPSVTGTFLDRYATHLEQEQNILWNGQNELQLKFEYQSAAAGATCDLNKFELFGRRNLMPNLNAPLGFRDWKSVGAGNIARFQFPYRLTGMRVWDVTDPTNVVTMQDIGAGGYTFNNDASRLREYFSFLPTHIKIPSAVGRQDNQNLHGLLVPEYLIITHPLFMDAALRLADFHRKHYNRTVQVISVKQVYNEFAGANPDPTAVRDFIKMLYDKKSGLKYVLLMGSGSYDPRSRFQNNYSFIPTYQSSQSLDPLSSFTSDDFFGMLDDQDDINQQNLFQTIDVAVGRIPARNIAEADMMVNKIINYHQTSRFGDWRNKLIFLADDEDQNLHLNDAEAVSAATANPVFQVQKIYLDAFPQVGGAGGNRYPAVNEALVNRVNNGALILNYSGHGNHLRLAEEAVLTVDEVNQFNNSAKLPLIVTASCDFYPFDDPTKNALGAQVLTGDSTGAIGLLTTARLVFASSNKIINEYFIQSALHPDPQTGKYRSLGEAVQLAKNNAVLNAGEVLNTRKFLLLGDPAMQLAFPEHRIRLTKFQNNTITGVDTLRASNIYQLEGIIEDVSGIPVQNFKGPLSLTVFDKPQTVQTLGNDPASPVTGFQQQSAILFKGTFSVDSGYFKLKLILPKDVSFQPGRARISLYANSNTTDAASADTGFVLIGNNQTPEDKIGPAIRLYLNDTLFRNGGLTHETPTLLAYLSDSAGINTSGNGIGHDITLVIDNQVRDIRVLNDWYVADLNSWQSGTIHYPLPVQTKGPHSLVLKAWDGANNSTEARLDYVVAEQEKLAISKVLNFPNPFRDRTRFSFEHNQPGKKLQVELRIYSTAGQLIKRLTGPFQSTGTRNIQVEWDGRDESGRKIQKAVYIYQIIIQSGTQQSVHAGQLILL
ncbi:MAG: type IX secretion system sortase PorU [Sediminibacterium sp.]